MVYCSADPATAILEVAVHFVVIPSAVTQESWNLIFNPMRAAGRYELDTQERYSLDTRLNPPTR
ncbi:MAG TPA: hypothetical protein VNZ26_14210 [Vicinamibacterales bacterium]|nr:hypothetical protein [Vicinamibacterales bacterium]